MRVAIIGARGFIGSRLAAHLQSNGDDVVSLMTEEVDLRREESFVNIPENVDALVHAAGLVGDQCDHDELWRVNVVSMYNLVRYLNQTSRPDLLVYLSSGAVYGKQSQPVTRSSELRPDGSYAFSKLLAETLIQRFFLRKYIICRLFFPFGPGQLPPRVIPRLIEGVYQGKSININTSGGPLLNPIFIDDLVLQISHLIHSDPSAAQPCFNLGGDRTVSMKSLTNHIGELLSRRVNYMIGGNCDENMYCNPDLFLGTGQAFETQLSLTVQYAVDTWLKAFPYS